jgi:hypothetical protein
LEQALGAAGAGSGVENDEAELTDETGDGAGTGGTQRRPHFGQNFCVALSVKWHDAQLCSPPSSEDDEFDADEFVRCSGADEEKLLLGVNGAGDEKLATLVPHCKQNFCCAFRAEWQLAHALDEAAGAAAADVLDPVDDTDSVESRMASCRSCASCLLASNARRASSSA